MTSEQNLDPEIRTAVLKLFRANDEFRQAYADWVSAPSRDAPAKLRLVGEAESHIDQARLDLIEAERRAREHFVPHEKTFDPKLP